MSRRILHLISIAPLAVLSYAAGPPQIEISNEAIRAKLYLPDAAEGFYRATRFDWSGVIHSLVYQGHDYYGPWFSQFDPSVRDFTHRDGQIVVGAVSAMTGPVEEFQRPVAYDTAAAGGTFIKVGVGVLRKPDDTNYAAFKAHEIVDSGKWKVNKKADSVEFVQELNDSSSGYSYVYSKTIRLTPGKPEMVMSHRLTNTGRLPIRTNVYNHNFLVLDRLPPGPDYTITVPFEINTTRPPDPEFAAIRGNRIAYAKILENHTTGHWLSAACNRCRCRTREKRHAPESLAVQASAEDVRVMDSEFHDLTDDATPIIGWRVDSDQAFSIAIQAGVTRRVTQIRMKMWNVNGRPSLDNSVRVQ